MAHPSLELEADVLKKAQRDNDQYHRQITDYHEQVNFQPNTTLRFFVNNVPVSYEVHCHPVMEMIMPIQNIYTAIIRQQTYELTPGDILLIPSGELHRLIAPDSGIRLIYLIDLKPISGIRGYSYLTAFLSNAVLITPDTCAPIYDQEAELMMTMCREYFSDRHLRELNCYADLLMFFANYGEFKMSQNDTGTFPTVYTEKQVRLYDKLSSVFDYMNQHYNENLSLENAANVAGFSKYHFSRLFKQCSGYNFYDYLCLLRINAAEKLLTIPDLSITEVALQSGFSSLSTFNRTFKKLKNCTPSEYRILSNQNVSKE